MKNFWLSWYATKLTGSYTLHWPWWYSGARLYLNGEQDPTICAAVQAESESSAKEIVLAAHDKRPEAIEWRFCEERPADWTPFCDRFERAEWMHWPASDATVH